MSRHGSNREVAVARHGDFAGVSAGRAASKALRAVAATAAEINGVLLQQPGAGEDGGGHSSVARKTQLHYCRKWIGRVVVPATRG